VSHLDPDLAALLALGEDVADDEQRAHLAECPACTAEVQAFRRAVTAGRSGSGPALLDPPPRVWEAIAAELDLPVDDASAAPTSVPAPATQPEPAETAPAPAQPAPAHTAAPAQPAAPAAPEAPAAHLAPRGRGMRRRPLVFGLIGAAAAAVIVAGVFTSGILNPRPVVLSEASLSSFPGWDGAEGAAVLEEVDGHHAVVVRLDAQVPSDGYREVWLLTDDASDLVSLGVLEGEEGVFTLPDDVDLDRFTVVDISQEDDDGDPTHSGDSIVRGELAPA